MTSSERAPLRRRLANRLLGPFLSNQARREIILILEDLRESRIETHHPLRAHLRYWMDLLGFIWTAIISKGELEPLETNLRPWRRAGSPEGLIPAAVADIRFSLRSFAGTPILSLVALTTIALAVGANTAIFSFADALLFRPMAISEPDRVVAFFHQSTVNPDQYSPFSYPDFQDFRDQTQALSGLASYSQISVTQGTGSDAAQLDGMIVSGNFFSVIGVQPPLGRAFSPEEDQTPETHPVAVISQSLWRRQYGGESSAIGKEIILNDRPFTIIGVAPPDMPAPGVFSRPDIWVPMMMHETILPNFEMQGINLFYNRGTHWLGLLGRMDDGVELEAARASLRSMAQRQAAEYPETNQQWSVALVPVEAARLGPPSNRMPGRVVGLLGAVTGMVLLIACANVANLLLARAELRRREMAIRMSLGAGRGRLIRQLLTESLLLSLTAGALGVLLAFWSGHLLSDLWATVGPGDPVLRLDERVIFFALALASITGLVFGILPAIQASVGGIAGSRGKGGLGGRPSNRGPSLQRTLVALQVAFSIVLMVGAGLTLRTVWNLRALPMGFDVQGVHTIMADPSHDQWTQEEERQLQKNLVQALARMTGVQSASMTLIAPLSGQRMADDIEWQGSTSGEPGGRMNVDMNIVEVGFFETMGIRTLQGRTFSRDDQPGTERVAVINEALAARLWPGESALGHSFRPGAPSRPSEPLKVVGVVEDGRYYRSWRTADRPFVFLPMAQHFANNPYPLFRDRPGRGPSEESVLGRVREIAPELRHPRVVSLESALANSVARERTTARLLILFGALALVIAGIGIYGVTSFSVTRRNHELGVRIALGASGIDVGRQVAKESVLPVLAGALVGFVAAWVLGRFVEGLLFGVQPLDPLTMVSVVGTISLTGIMASFIPARRAAMVDPVEIMNADE